jgi:hypothetical protein
MPEAKTIERARKARKEGKALTTAAGEFVREEIEHVRKGKHGARSPKQIIAIGLAKARRAGIPLPAPRAGRASSATRRKAASDQKAGRRRSAQAASTRGQRKGTTARRTRPAAKSSTRRRAAQRRST